MGTMTTPMSPLKMSYRVVTSLRIPYILTILMYLKILMNLTNYIYQHFQDSEKIHQIDPKSETIMPDDDSLYLYVNNDIEYGLFEDIVDSYYLDGQIKDDFQCDHDCYSYLQEWTVDDHTNTCTHDYHHIAQSVQDLSDNIQQNSLHSLKENALSFADDTAAPCDFNITDQHAVMQNANDNNIPCMPKQFGIHSQ